jgi:hypothetical protein
MLPEFMQNPGNVCDFVVNRQSSKNTSSHDLNGRPVTFDVNLTSHKLLKCWIF